MASDVATPRETDEWLLVKVFDAFGVELSSAPCVLLMIDDGVPLGTGKKRCHKPLETQLSVAACRLKQLSYYRQTCLPLT